ncbi:MAG: alpha-amylase family glycosyl hydrolase [Pseudomonadota bacterium]
MLRELSGIAAAIVVAQSGALAQTTLDRPIEDDVIYFMLPDRFENGDPSNDTGGMEGGPLDHGFNPKHKGFYHGGDLAGLRSRLDYLEELGVTAIWLGPIYKNKPVQGAKGQESAGYHGYWITDFTDVDPHFGTKEELKAFVADAHARDMKVILDIITNHTADVIAYRECHDADNVDDAFAGCPYLYEGAYPYTTRGTADGETINEDFLGFGVATKENFANLKRADWAYTPYLPEGQEDVKRPAWLNDPIYYHNRGDFNKKGESYVNGDFFGLDDLMTEHPVVVEGMIEIFRNWITEYDIDGFRVDTARHVRPQFWQQFIPAMLETAEGQGKENFTIFGEVYDFDPGALARFTWDDGFPTVLDFGFQGAVRAVVAEGEPTQRLADLFAADTLYRGGRSGARKLPTFLGNHDMGRFAMFIREANPYAGEEEIVARLKLAHMLLLTTRGAPTLYSGGEQGFISDEGDQGAREDMFPSVTDVYNDNDVLGTDKTTAESNFDTDHPIFTYIKNLISMRRDHVALRRGTQITRYAEEDGNLFIFSRIAPDGTEIVVGVNTGTEDREIDAVVEAHSTTWSALYGVCGAKSQAQASYKMKVPALDSVVCKTHP